MFDNDTIRSAIREARRLDVHPAALLAVMEVESNGKVYALVNGRNEPLIRFEGHYFDKRLTKEQKAAARAKGLSDPKVGGVKNPVKQDARYALLNRAAAINKQAAYESCSWGLGQVMGAHWKWLGFSSVDNLVLVARSGAAGQIQLMAKFIDKSGLTLALRRLDWAAFARGYNGPAYKKNAYDTKMAKAYAKWLKFDLSKLNATPVDYQKTPETIIKQISVASKPDNEPVASGKFKTTRLVAAIVAAVSGAAVWLQCSLPTSFIQWAGYAAKCKGDLQ